MQRLAANAWHLGIDIRGGDSMDLIVEALMYMKKQFPTLKILFLRASSPILMKRFQETRRKHPLADTIHLSDAIEQERVMMQPLVDRADMIFDTDQLTIHQLRSTISTTFADAQAQKIVVSLISFGFKYGIPTESNYVFDVRSLPNPYFVESLRCYSGTDARINEFLFEKQAVREYWERLIDFIRYAIAKSYEEGRCFINVAIGCTGGKHRSVAFIEKVALEKMPHTHFLLQHRDIDREYGLKVKLRINKDGVYYCVPLPIRDILRPVSRDSESSGRTEDDIHSPFALRVFHE